MSSGKTAEDPTFKLGERAEEARYFRQKEQAQLEAIRQECQEKEHQKPSTTQKGVHPMDKGFESGFGGQEDLEDRYATTSGEH